MLGSGVSKWPREGLTDMADSPFHLKVGFGRLSAYLANNKTDMYTTLHDIIYIHYIHYIHYHIYIDT